MTAEAVARLAADILGAKRGFETELGATWIAEDMVEHDPDLADAIALGSLLLSEEGPKALEASMAAAWLETRAPLTGESIIAALRKRLATDDDGG